MLKPCGVESAKQSPQGSSWLDLGVAKYNMKNNSRKLSILKMLSLPLFISIYISFLTQFLSFKYFLQFGNIYT